MQDATIHVTEGINTSVAVCVLFEAASGTLKRIALGTLVPINSTAKGLKNSNVYANGHYWMCCDCWTWDIYIDHVGHLNHSLSTYSCTEKQKCVCVGGGGGNSSCSGLQAPVHVSAYA